MVRCGLGGTGLSKCYLGLDRIGLLVEDYLCQKLTFVAIGIEFKGHFTLAIKTNKQKKTQHIVHLCTIKTFNILKLSL